MSEEQETTKKKKKSGAPAAEVVAGTSLWKDAFRRLLKNKAACTGGVIVLLMIMLAVGADVIASSVTHYTPIETHLSYVIKPPGARSVPEEHMTFFDAGGEYGVAFVDADKDGFVTTGEITDALQKVEFAHYDLDGNGTLSASEYNTAPHGLVGPEAEFKVIDEDADGQLSLEETWKFTDIFPREEADTFVRRFDTEGKDRKLAVKTEFPGVPEPHTHFLGCDTRGRDLLTRLIYGGRISLAVGLLATLVSFLIGVTWGAVSGFLGGRVDNVMMRIVDIMYGIPFMFLVILLMVVFGENILLLFLALGAVQWLTMSRIVRGQIISLKNREFVEAAESIGVSKIKIIFKHLIPNALGPIIVYSTLLVPAVMLEEAFLSFLGLGVQPPDASWGSLASEGREYLELYPWLILYPGLALAITLLSMNFLGDGLRDALDPQLKKD